MSINASCPLPVIHKIDSSPELDYLKTDDYDPTEEHPFADDIIRGVLLMSDELKRLEAENSLYRMICDSKEACIKALIEQIDLLTQSEKLRKKHVAILQKRLSLYNDEEQLPPDEVGDLLSLDVLLEDSQESLESSMKEHAALEKQLTNS